MSRTWPTHRAAPHQLALVQRDVELVATLDSIGDAVVGRLDGRMRA